MHVCVYMCMHICKHIYIYIYICMYLLIHLFICIYVSICILYVCISAYVSMYNNIYMCVCLPMNVYIHTYHTNTSTNTMLLVKLAKSHNFMSLPSSHEDVQPIPSPVGRFPNIPQILMIRLCQVRLLRASCLVSPVLDCTANAGKPRHFLHPSAVSRKQTSRVNSSEYIVCKVVKNSIPAEKSLVTACHSK